MADAWLGPDDGQGSVERTETIETMVYLQLTNRRDSFIADPDLGNDAHLIPRNNDMTTALRLKDSYTQALRPFAAEGLAEDLVIEIDRDQRGEVAIRSSMRDAQHGGINLQNALSFRPGDR